METPLGLQSIGHIVAAVDFGVASTRAVATAIDLARTLHAQLTLLHTVEPPPYPYPIAAEESVRSRLRQSLDDIVAAAQRTGVEARGLLAEGPAWREIVRVASALHANLLVLGTHGRRGFSRVILGSTAEKVVRASNVPVLTVPPFRFDDLADAGRRLGRALQSRELRDVVVLGVGRQGAVVGAHVAHALRAPLDVLLLEPIGTNGDVVGVFAEGDRWLLRDDSHGTVTAPAERLHGTIERASDALEKEVAVVRRREPRLGLAGRTVVLVCARASNETELEVAALSARKAGASRVLAAIPVARARTIEHLRGHVDDLVSLEVTDCEAEVDEAYRQEDEPKPSTVARALHRARSAAPHAARPAG